MRTRCFTAALLLQLAYSVIVHGGELDNASSMASLDTARGAPFDNEQGDVKGMPTYSGLSEYSGLMMAHIFLMTIAWFFMLPIAVVFSIARSRLALPVRLIFLVLNGLGVLSGIIYNVKTPDLYENNAHHTIGWIGTWLVTAQTVMGLLFASTGRSKNSNSAAAERATFLPLPTTNKTRQRVTPHINCHWPSSSSQSSEPALIHETDETSPTASHQLSDDFEKPEGEDDDSQFETFVPRCRSSLHNRLVGKYLPARSLGMLPYRLLKVLRIVYKFIDRTILVFGFITLISGVVAYSGIFRGNHIFNGLAHSIKGGIFFWYGLLTLGRWMGCFAEFGWAWNVKPSYSEGRQWSATIRSAEFVESFVIFLYGSTNVFLEHLAAWGRAWSAQDLEHVSISIMFFGGGLCGMLVESKKIRKWLNTTVGSMPARGGVDAAEAVGMRTVPRTYKFSMNPIPALVILLLGITMSSHHQSSPVSATVHKQWGFLLSAFSVMRILTYLIMYISPPISIYPSRPPSELLSSFCLISGGIVFMASAKDVVHWMEVNDLMATFVFTVTVGLTAFIMAYEILVLALKGWAVRREGKRSEKRVSAGR